MPAGTGRRGTACGCGRSYVRGFSRVIFGEYDSAARLQAGPSRRVGPGDRGAGAGAGLPGRGRKHRLPEGDVDAAAMVLVTEIGDFRRFEDPGKLMAYVGLVSTAHSPGGSRRQGSITKAGNGRVRHALVQAAWSYRFPPRRGVKQRRQEGRPPEVVAHSWKAQHRFHMGFYTSWIELVRAGRSPGALAREFEPSGQTLRNGVRQVELDEVQEPHAIHQPDGQGGFDDSPAQ